MDSPTPETLVSDFLEDKKRTDLQKQQIWKESYAGRRISWRGKLDDCRGLGDSDLIKATVDIEVKGEKRLGLLVECHWSEKEKLLSLQVGDYVRVTGVLNSVYKYFSYKLIDVGDGRISRV